MKNPVNWLLSAAASRMGLVGARLFELQNLLNRPRDVNQSVIRKLCSSAYLGDQTVLCRVLGRYKMFTDTRDVGLSSHLIIDGYWEMWLTEEIMRTVKAGMIVADVGANLGYFTLLMADLVGADGYVHAFEPNDPISQRLRRSVMVNGFAERVTVHDAPLGSEEGRLVSMAVPDHEPKNAHVISAVEGSDAVVKATQRMDGLAALRDVDVLKIDAEGAELDIWHGMAGILAERRKPMTIFLEFASVRYADPAHFLSEISSHGFSIGELTLADGVVQRSHAELLAAPGDVDQMLVLKRR